MAALRVGPVSYTHLFWVWDEWNNLNVEHIIIAIFVVGIVGLLLEQALILIAKKFTYE